MKIETMVKLSNTKDNSELYSLFCRAAKGDFIEHVKDKGYVAHLEHEVGNAFDKFAQEMFEAGMRHERNSVKK